MATPLHPFAVRLIEGANNDPDLFDDTPVELFWVDWREADEDIVTMVAEALERGPERLAPAWQDDRLYIDCDGRRTLVPLAFEPGEQGLTLRTLNQALAPGHEIRFARASDGADTLAFLVLSGAAWRALEEAYGTRAETAFQRLDEASTGPFSG